MKFIDETILRVQGGRGGNGIVAFRREKFVPKGGPSGGDGGNGGSVVLVGDEGLNTLYHLRFQSSYAADRGRHGEGSNKTGRGGGDLEVPVPLGTQVFEVGTGEKAGAEQDRADPEADEPQGADPLLGEILHPGDRLVVAKGGHGGHGNARFATSTHQAPRRAHPGRAGEEKTLRLELKLLADVGVVGLPNAGKSTLIGRITAARPKIADYPFTTLVPQLGVVVPSGVAANTFVVADLPGLIAGAASGAGLGHQFLRHVERCRVLLHLVDLSAFEGSSADDLATIEAELAAFNPELMERPRLLVGSKSDAAREERREELKAAAEERDLPYYEISSATGDGIQPLLHELSRRLDAIPVAAEEEGGGEGAPA